MVYLRVWKQRQHTLHISTACFCLKIWKPPSLCRRTKRQQVTCLCLMLKLRWDIFFLEDNCYFSPQRGKKILLYISIMELKEFSSLSELKGLIRFYFNVRSWLEGTKPLKKREGFKRGSYKMFKCKHLKNITRKWKYNAPYKLEIFQSILKTLFHACFHST